MDDKDLLTKALKIRHRLGGTTEVSETKMIIQQHLKEKAEKEGCVHLESEIAN